MYIQCGTINSLKLFEEQGELSATAFVEFESKDDVLAAKTRDMKTFEDRPIEVEVGSCTTLFVTNFPPTADESWIKDKFKAVSEDRIATQ